MIHTLKNMIGSGTDWTKAVLTGRAYAVQWPETGDLEKILGNGLGEIRE